MNRVKSFRKLQGLTQGALAEMAGVRQPHIARIERGDSGVTLKVYCKIAEVLNVPLYTLFLDDLSEVELEIIQLYRSLPEDRRAGWDDALALAVASSRKEGQ